MNIKGEFSWTKRVNSCGNFGEFEWTLLSTNVSFFGWISWTFKPKPNLTLKGICLTYSLGQKMSTRIHPLKVSTRICPFWKKCLLEFIVHENSPSHWWLLHAYSIFWNFWSDKLNILSWLWAEMKIYVGFYSYFPYFLPSLWERCRRYNHFLQ